MPKPYLKLTVYDSRQEHPIPKNRPAVKHGKSGPSVQKAGPTPLNASTALPMLSSLFAKAARLQVQHTMQENLQSPLRGAASMRPKRWKIVHRSPGQKLQ